GEPSTPGFEILDVGISGQVEAFFQYFQQEWLLDAKVLLCNVYGVAVPTTNHLESWHSGMNKRARENHLGFCHFLQLIIDEQGKTETVVRQMDDGYTWGRGSVRRSAAYGIRQRLVAAPMRRLPRNEKRIEHFLNVILIIFLHLYDYNTSALFIIVVHIYSLLLHSISLPIVYIVSGKQKYFYAQQSAD
ncbi:hypothetical protein T05_15099, partial [Trichinella murrelli]